MVLEARFASRRRARVPALLRAWACALGVAVAGPAEAGGRDREPAPRDGARALLTAGGGATFGVVAAAAATATVGAYVHLAGAPWSAGAALVVVPPVDVALGEGAARVSYVGGAFDACGSLLDAPRV